MLSGLVIGLLCVIAVAPSNSVFATRAIHGDGCGCPEVSIGWTVYPDSARGTPDFFAERSVQVSEILLCERGAHLLFRARQEGARCRVCLVIAEPTLDQLLRRLPPDSVPGDGDLDKIGAHLEFERSLFAERMRKLRDLLERPADGNQRASFQTGWFRNPPRLYPGSPFVVRWKDRRVELTGIVDVFFQY
ncbi:MAG TPA: hypothetical protein VFX78_12975 [Candidatus Eisenbacteria bacterium]|nr:hypothetical protein [Candidatus Eisenbacteria bacterium]